jgi:hypothetical protein
MESTREDIAWAAGLFEGEGCFSLQSRGNPRATLSMTDFDVVRRFAEVVGFGTVFDKVPPRLPHHKPQLAWRVTSFERTQALIAMFWPWLGERRRARAVEILATARYHRGIARTNANKTACKHGHPFDEANTYIDRGTGARRCRACKRAAWRAWKARHPTSPTRGS